MGDIDTTQPIVFEVSWEVANKVGGIYTVIRSKAPSSIAQIGDNNYFCIGIYNGEQARTEVEVCEPPNFQMAECLRSMREQGVNVVFGRWLIDGYPKVVLFDIGSVWGQLNNWKGDFFHTTRIGLDDNDTETNNAIVLGYLVCWFLGDMSHRLGRPVMVGQFHEWQTAVGLILLRTRHIPVATVFTTHATLLGRYLCAGSTDFYNNLSHFDCDYEAGKRQIYPRYCLERAGAHSSHVFTTVSQVTALEAEHLLRRKPEVILPNGLNVVKFAALHEFQNLHAVKKEKIHNFVRGHFYGHFDFDLEKTLYFFLAGRYEFQNKGADMFIEALARLNHRMKAANSDKTVVAFIIMPASVNNYNVEALKGQAVTKSLRETVKDVQGKIGKRIFEAALKGRTVPREELLTKEDDIHIKRCIYNLQRTTLPPITTHNMVDDSKDPILNELRRCGLFNSVHDRVKVIFHPEFLKSTSPLIPLDYDEFVRGCHMGVFPSYYEPWGYTPAECTVMGVPNISSNLSGFGCFMEDHVQDPSSYGIHVIDRRFKSPDESMEQLVTVMYDFIQLDRRQRINLRNRTERLSELLDWKRLGAYYKKARDLACKRTFTDFNPEDEEVVEKVPPPKSPKVPLSELPPDSDDEDQGDHVSHDKFNFAGVNKS